MDYCAECGGEVISDYACCAKCNQPIDVCSDCNTIAAGCDCGHCEAGATFHEE